MILLDSCVLIWLESDVKKISVAARRELNKPGQRAFASAISAYEIGQKARRNLLTLSKPIDQWFAHMLIHHSLVELEVSSTVAARAVLLPSIHQDPFDRLLIATAIERQLAILTPDPWIQKYPNLKTIW
jgi:PIN domain nuclease of toxin-antitoxin system